MYTLLSHEELYTTRRTPASFDFGVISKFGICSNQKTGVKHFISFNYCFIRPQKLIKKNGFFYFFVGTFIQFGSTLWIVSDKFWIKLKE